MVLGIKGAMNDMIRELGISPAAGKIGRQSARQTMMEVNCECVTEVIPPIPLIISMAIQKAPHDLCPLPNLRPKRINADLGGWD